MKYCRHISFSGNAKQRRKAIRRFLRKNQPFFELRPCRFRKDNLSSCAVFEVWQEEIEF